MALAMQGRKPILIPRRCCDAMFPCGYFRNHASFSDGEQLNRLRFVPCQRNDPVSLQSLPAIQLIAPSHVKCQVRSLRERSCSCVTDAELIEFSVFLRGQLARMPSW